MSRANELPQEGASVTLASWPLVTTALRWDRAKTARKLEARGAVQLSGRDLTDVRLRTLDACLEAVGEQREGVVMMPFFAWWYVASALHARIKRNEYLIERNVREDNYDEGLSSETETLRAAREEIDILIVDRELL